MDELTRKALLDLLQKCNPKTRSTFAQIIQGKVSDEGGIPFIREELGFLDPDMAMRKVTLLESHLCDCGKLISQKNPLLGKCQHPGCKSYVCAECSKVCSRCGKTVCQQPGHFKQYKDGTIYCVRCWPFKLLKLFFDIEDRRSDE